MSTLWERQRAALAREQADPAELAIATDPIPPPVGPVTGDFCFAAPPDPVAPTVVSPPVGDGSFSFTTPPLRTGIIKTTPRIKGVEYVEATIKVEARPADIPALLRRLADQISRNA